MSASITVQNALTVTCAGGAPLGVPGTWALALFDDFNGVVNSAPNQTIWHYWDVNTDRGTDIGGSPFWLRAENSYLSGDGSLVLRITDADIGYGAQLSSGGVESNQQFGPGCCFQYLMKHATNGGHSAGWAQTKRGMQGHNTPPDPADGYEIDVSEYASGFPVSYNMHYGGYGPNHHETGLVSYGVNPTDWHTYSCVWGAAGYDFYLDGALKGSVNSLPPATNIDQVMRLVIEANLGGGTSCFAYVDTAWVWVPA